MYKITGTNKASFEKVRSGVKHWCEFSSWQGDFLLQSRCKLVMRALTPNGLQYKRGEEQRPTKQAEVKMFDFPDFDNFMLQKQKEVINGYN